MCGIVGFINKKRGCNKDSDKIFRDMMWVNQLRGTDGSGVFAIDNVGDVEIAKVPSCYEVLASNKKFSALATRLDSKVFVVGHNRYATLGENKVETTHPFKTKNIVLVHNGTLSSYPEKDNKNSKYLMDSHAITCLIEDQGIDKTIEHIQGTWSLVWYDMKEKTLNFHRNEQRPMWFIEVANHEITFFASEPDFALLAIHRYGLRSSKIEEMKANKLISFNLDDREGRSRALIKKEIIVTKDANNFGKSKRKKVTGMTIPEKLPKNQMEFLYHKWGNEQYKGDVEFDEILTERKEVHRNHSVIPFCSSHDSSKESNSKRRIKDVSDEIRNKFRIGSNICFSLLDVENVRKGNQYHAEQNKLIGSLPPPYSEGIEIEGYTGIEEEFFYVNDSLYNGTIIAVFQDVVFDKIIISVKEIRVSLFKDPSTKTKWEMEPDSSIIKARPSELTFLQRKDKVTNLVQCDICNGWYVNDSKNVTQYLIEGARIPVYECVNCIEEEDRKQTKKQESELQKQFEVATTAGLIH